MARAAGPDLSASSQSLARRVGARIREQRNALGQTLNQTAGAAGISVSHLSSIETGANLPSLPLLARIVAVLGLALNDVLREVGGDGGSISVGRLNDGLPGTETLSHEELQLRVVSLVADPGEQGGCPLATDGAGIFVFVCRGALETTVDGTVTVLETGDSLDADEPRRVSWRVVGAARCVSAWARGPLRAG